MAPRVEDDDAWRARVDTITAVPTALLHLVAVALVISGIDKLRSPRPAGQALRDAGVAVPGRWGTAAAGLVLGAVEVGLGAVALLAGGPVAAAAVATLYLGFASFVLRLRSRDDTAGCGCFGASSAPPGRAHLLLDLGAAAGAVVAVFVQTDTLIDVVRDGAPVAVPYIVLLTTGGALLLLGPALFAALREVQSGRSPRPFAVDG